MRGCRHGMWVMGLGYIQAISGVTVGFGLSGLASFLELGRGAR